MIELLFGVIAAVSIANLIENTIIVAIIYGIFED